MCKWIIRLKSERLVEQWNCRRYACWHQFVDVRQRLKHQVIGTQTFRALAFHPLDFDLLQPGLDSADHADRNFILNSKDIFELPIITFAPDLCAALRLDQLRGNPYSIARFSNTAFQDVADAKIASHLP